MLDRYAFGILSDYLSLEIAVAVKQFLNISDAKCEEIVDMNMYGKRKAEDEDMIKERPTKAGHL